MSQLVNGIATNNLPTVVGIQLIKWNLGFSIQCCKVKELTLVGNKT